MWWKIYSWILIILGVLTVLFMVSGVKEWTVYDWIIFISAILSMLVLYSHLYRRDLLTQQTWKILFWISVGFGVLDFIMFLSPLRESYTRSGIFVGEYAMSTNLNEYLFYLLVGMPIYYANYILAYGTLRQNKSHKKAK